MLLHACMAQGSVSGAVSGTRTAGCPELPIDRVK
eukprot:COSAG02_NODE_68562_length_237_cov_5.253623_1_plen_33_part_10